MLLKLTLDKHLMETEVLGEFVVAPCIQLSEPGDAAVVWTNVFQGIAVVSWKSAPKPSCIPSQTTVAP